MLAHGSGRRESAVLKNRDKALGRVFSRLKAAGGPVSTTHDALENEPNCARTWKREPAVLQRPRHCLQLGLWSYLAYLLAGKGCRGPALTPMGPELRTLGSGRVHPRGLFGPSSGQSLMGQEAGVSTLKQMRFSHRGPQQQMGSGDLGGSPASLHGAERRGDVGPAPWPHPPPRCPWPAWYGPPPPSRRWASESGVTLGARGQDGRLNQHPPDQRESRPLCPEVEKHPHPNQGLPWSLAPSPAQGPVCHQHRPPHRGPGVAGGRTRPPGERSSWTQGYLQSRLLFKALACLGSSSVGWALRGGGRGALAGESGATDRPGLESLVPLEQGTN